MTTPSVTRVKDQLFIMLLGAGAGWIATEYLPHEAIMGLAILITFVGGVAVGILIENQRVWKIIQRHLPRVQ